MALKKQIRRSDGKVFESVADAARQVIAEQGVGSELTVRANISNVANGRYGYRTAYQYRWEFV